MQKLLTIDKDHFISVMQDIKAMQDMANSVTTESEVWEITNAFQEHKLANGHIDCLSKLELLSSVEYSELFMRQFQISEKLKDLLDRKKPMGIPVPHEPKHNIPKTL